MVSPDRGLYQCLESLERIAEVINNVIVVNQSEIALSISQSYGVRVLNVDKLSASSARNMGARVATANYLFFIDDDAYISAAEIHDFRKTLQHNLDVISAKRWDVKVKWNTLPSIYTLPNYFIEWNIIIKRKLFLEMSGFDEIGVGSNHPAQSGEAFILLVKAIRDHRARLGSLSSMEIRHPRLDISLRSEKARGYLYGLGYSIGFSMKHMSIMQKVYWCARLMIAFSKRIYLEMAEKEDQDVKFTCNTLQILVGFMSGLREAKNENS